MVKSFKYRLYPKSSQIEMLQKTFGCIRFVYNWALDIKEKAYQKDKTNISFGSLDKQKNDLRNNTEWLKEISSIPLQQKLRDLNIDKR